MLHQEVGFVVNKLRVETHDGPAGGNLLGIEKAEKQLPNRKIHEGAHGRKVVASGEAVRELPRMTDFVRHLSYPA
jgi:hypothetical protein